MAKKSKRKKTTRGAGSNRRPWYYLIAIGILIIVVVFLRGNYGFVRYMQLRKQKQNLVEEIKRLTAKRDHLKEEIQLLSSDYQYIKKILREKYRMGEKGEKIFFVAPADKGAGKKKTLGRE
ncbi:MAG: septum formation initiator family protein [Calditrichaeota bacterium]|nr:septum formation initiator family protein [Calditrichota bacterium]